MAGYFDKVVEFIVQWSLYVPIGRWLLFIAGFPWCVGVHWNIHSAKENGCLRKMGLRFLYYYNADDEGKEIKFLNKCALCILLNLIILYFSIEFNEYEVFITPSMCGGFSGIAFFFAIVMFFDDQDVLITALCKAVSVPLTKEHLEGFTKDHRNFNINFILIISGLFGVFCTYLSDWIINVKVLLDCHVINPDNSTHIPCQLEDLIFDGYCCNAVELDGDMGAFFAVIGGIFTSIKGVVYVLASSTIGSQRETYASSRISSGLHIRLTTNVRNSVSSGLRSIASSIETKPRSIEVEETKTKSTADEGKIGEKNSDLTENSQETDRNLTSANITSAQAKQNTLLRIEEKEKV